MGPLPRPLFQDSFILVIEKPSGLPSQPDKGGGANVHDLLRDQHDYVGLHHRLDTPASGLMVLALDRRANKGLADGFRTHKIRREYKVVVLGDPGANGTWDAPLDGKTATTHWTRIARGGGMSHLEISLGTGRTHQVRRHAVDQGHPVLGDRRHGGAAGRLWPRLALHAWRLHLSHPVSGKPLVFESKLPEDLAPLFEKIA